MELNVLTPASGESEQITVAEGVFNRPLIMICSSNYRGLSGRARQGSKAQKHVPKFVVVVSSLGAKRHWSCSCGYYSKSFMEGRWSYFATKPREYDQKVNRKMYQAAMCTILSRLVAEDRLILLDTIEVQTCKTKDFKTKLPL